MRGNKGLLFLVIALIAGALLVLYFIYYAKESKKGPLFEAGERSPEAEDTIQLPHERLKDILGEGVVEGQPMRVEDECLKMEREIREFCAYLDTQDYVRELGIEEDTFAHFKKIILALSSYPPLPAGEGINYDMIIKNIYHFYRVLDLKDIKLIRRILKNEADSMEINLALFYRWLMSGDECKQKEGLPPSWDTTYRYAGFLINSIGGRAYLFRRDTRLRLLTSYYCLLIIHEADRKKMNSFGIDIIPFLEPLAEEIENNQLLYFRKEYAGKLIELKEYYLRKRSTS